MEVTKGRRIFQQLLGALLISMLMLPATARSLLSEGSEGKCEKGVKTYLYVWAGPSNTTTAKDFLSTFDATPSSPTFGQLLSRVDVEAKGTEPHHVGLSADKRVLAAGGLLSFLSGQPDVFFFDIAGNPAVPKVIANATATRSGGTDAFLALPKGGFLATMMTSRAGKSPGAVAEFSADLKLTAEYPPAGQAPAAFNPHGIAAIGESVNRLVTVNFIELASTLLPTAGPVFQTTLNIWDYKKRAILKTLDLGPSKARGLMDALYIPGTNGLFYVTTGLGGLHVVDSRALTVTDKPVYELIPGTQVPGNCLFTLVSPTRLLSTSFALDQVRLLDISTPYSPKTLQIYSYIPQVPGTSVGPHAIAADTTSGIFATSQYFVQQDPTKGIVTTVSEKTVRLFNLDASLNSFTPSTLVPVIDFKTLFPDKGECRPHGMVFKTLCADS